MFFKSDSYIYWYAMPPPSPFKLAPLKCRCKCPRRCALFSLFTLACYIREGTTHIITCVVAFKILMTSKHKAPVVVRIKNAAVPPFAPTNTPRTSALRVVDIHLRYSLVCDCLARVVDMWKCLPYPRRGRWSEGLQQKRVVFLHVSLFSCRNSGYMKCYVT